MTSPDDRTPQAATSETSGMPRWTTSPRPAPLVGEPSGWQPRVIELLSEGVERVVVDRGELTLYVEREALPSIARTARDHPELRFEMLAGVSGVDYPADERRLHAVYHLLSMTFRRRIRVEVAVTEADPHVPSVVGIWPTADWHERETWDFFGIVFDGHPGLTRIQMPDDWEGHPQRKDYPLGGVPVEYKGAEIPPPELRRAWA